MSSEQRRPPQLGATFYPGGVDDFYMPEVISPSPQRITPEVPEKIQDNIAHLELEAAPVNRLSGIQSPSPIDGKLGIMPASFQSRNSSNYSVSSDPVQGQGYRVPYQTSDQKNQYIDIIDKPTFSPFPPLRKRPASVPPSDEEKEGILESARQPVLTSDDPEMQLSWAQDTLAWVEIASQNEAKISESQVARTQTPKIEHQLRVDAVSVVSFLADQHHPKATFMKGMWLEFGKFGFRLDKQEAFRSFQRAAQRGYARAEYRMGMQFEQYNEPDKAIKHYTLGVEAGDSASNYRLGMMTLLGQHGQPLNYEKGIKLVSYSAQTADENAPQGAYVYGMLLAHELPQISLPEQLLPLNISAARFNIEHAAYLGFAKAQTKMGAAYELCQLGCDFDPALSLHYNALAAKQGGPEADMAISKWFLCGYEGQFEKNEKLAFTYAQRAARSGLATAEFALGYFYEIGIYVPVDIKQSRLWYEKAADHGNKDAVARIEGISRSKTLSRKDHDQIAVAKIQSQYGSHRGKRPERFKNPSTPMPTISDDPIDMPEPSVPKSRPGQNQAYAYRASNAATRPSSAAPYPLDDGRGRPSPRPSNGSSYASPAPAGSMPIRPPSTTQSETSFGDNNFRGSGYPTFQSSRPKPGIESVAAGRGRAAPTYGSDSTPAGRGRSTPSHGQPTASGLEGQRQSAPGYTSSRMQGSPALNASRPQSAQPPAIDIGFSAPQDPSGADRRRRQQRIDGANMAQQGGGAPPGNGPHPGTLPRLSSYDGPDRNQGRLSSLPHPQTMPIRTTSPSPRPVTSGGRPGVSLQDPPSRPDSAATLPNLPPPKLPNLDRPTATPPPSGPAARPPGKGPKTFQEMGVPATKQESDCIVIEAEVSLIAPTSFGHIAHAFSAPPSRPYSATDISANLHNKVTKSQAVKTLKELHENQVIAGKAAGKQLVYHALQDPADAMSLEDLAAMDKEIAALRDSIATAKANEKLLRANLISVNATLSTDELRNSVILIEHEKKEVLGRLSPLRSGNMKPVLPEAKEAVDRDWVQWSRKAGVRKKICLELWEICTEEVPDGKTREELWEDWGLEGDDD